MAIKLGKKQALGLWRAALADSLRAKGADLSGRQMAIALTVYLAPPPHTVRGMARSLGISKPAVTRALDTLSALGFLRRKADPDDKRSVLVERTVKGSVYLNDFADIVMRAGQKLD